MKKFRIFIVCLCLALFSVILFNVCKYGVLDIDNNVYDISFKTDDKEFNYKLNAKTGKILKKATF